MRETNVCNDPNVGRGYFRQYRDFPGVIHSDFPNRDLVLRRGFQNCLRQTDVIIEISLCFRHSKPAGKNRSSEILGAGLAVASGNRDHT